MGDQSLKFFQLVRIGKAAKQKKVYHFFKTKPLFTNTLLDDFLDVDAAVKQTSLPWNFLTVNQIIAVYIAYGGDTRNHTGAVGIPQSPA